MNTGNASKGWNVIASIWNTIWLKQLCEVRAPPNKKKQKKNNTKQRINTENKPVQTKTLTFF